MKNNTQLEFIIVKPTCNRTWRQTRNSLSICWCPYCETSEGFKEVKNEQKKPI